METTKQSKSIYALVTERIITQLEKGVVPWRKTWGTAGQPMNLFTKQRYRGVNVLLLNSLNYAQNLFLTYWQADFYGGHVKQGEKGHLVIYSKFIEEKKEGEETPRRRYLLRYFTVFNVEQCEGLPKSYFPEREPEKIPLVECERIIKDMPTFPSLRFEKPNPFYHSKEDYINMPTIDSFEKSINFYEVLFHELCHSTGHAKRLARPEIVNNTSFGTDQYSKEELTAEIGACMLKSFAGIENCVSNNSSAYINGWLKVLKNDSRFILYSSAQAQRAVDYILNIQAPVDDSPKTRIG